MNSIYLIGAYAVLILSVTISVAIDDKYLSDQLWVKLLVLLTVTIILDKIDNRKEGGKK